MLTIAELEAYANNIRRISLDLALCTGRGGCHVGGGFSCIEIFAALYGDVLRDDPECIGGLNRDRFIGSKAHCVLPLYSSLILKGLLNYEEVKTFHDNNALLTGRPWRPDLGVEFSGGSLGMGLSLGIGMALSAKREHRFFNTYVLLGDGESNEGSVWEAIMSASHFKLDNLVGILDWNNMQFDGRAAEIMGMEPICDRLKSFGWKVCRVNGHDVGAVRDALRIEHKDRPLMIVADTIKARGIPGLEGRAESHHAVLTKEMYDVVMRDMKAGRYGQF